MVGAERHAMIEGHVVEAGSRDRVLGQAIRGVRDERSLQATQAVERQCSGLVARRGRRPRLCLSHTGDDKSPLPVE